MHVIAVKMLRRFWEEHPNAERPLRTWYDEARAAQWRSPQGIRAQYASASFIGPDRVVFNIGGNNYHLVVVVRYRAESVFIRFIGTHAAYDRIDVRSI